MMVDGILSFELSFDLSFEQGEVSLNNVLIPGILKSQSIKGSVRFDEAEADGLSGKVKTPLGWEDADISLTMELCCDDNSNCYSKLAAINAIFKGADNGGNPKVYDVVNQHTYARGINQVVFAGLDSSETDEDDVILVTLNFIEHLPLIVQGEKRVTASDQAVPKISSQTQTSEGAKKDPAIVEDNYNPFKAGYQTGLGE